MDMTSLGSDLGLNVTMVVNILYILCFTDESPRGHDYLGSDLGVNVTMVVNIFYVLCFTDESPRGHDQSWI